ncbi:unnamed protein product [Heligmosomoides polygyrus]|uniref:Uncharacterized protein n=1 Tax=Heligmosomoides polygyrus TaxID=6339 RepID=A0A183GSL2_HELPZ|nr:unnamed protein product [Heligmosomoides polygyrus]
MPQKAPSPAQEDQPPGTKTPPLSLATSTCQVPSETLIITALTFAPLNNDAQFTKAAYLDSIHRTMANRGSSILQSKDTTTPSGKIVGFPQRKYQTD